jgi:Uri superfamily endonuclease
MIERQGPTELIDAIGARGLRGRLIHGSDVTLLPADPGAYLLLIGLRRKVAIRGHPSWPESLPRGWYLYAGSAYGPGGLRGRLARHFRPTKVRHWHVDQLTAEGEIHAMAYAGRRECELVAALSGLPEITMPAPGFGSSDCRICRSHLLAYQPGRIP